MKYTHSNLNTSAMTLLQNTIKLLPNLLAPLLLDFTLTVYFLQDRVICLKLDQLLPHFSSCLLSSFSRKSKSLAWLIRFYSLWFLAAFLISCPASLPHNCTSGTWLFLFLQISNTVGPKNLAFLFPLPGMLFPRSFTHPTCHSNLNTNASNLNNASIIYPYWICTTFSYSFFFLVFNIIELSVCVCVCVCENCPFLPSRI